MLRAISRLRTHLPPRSFLPPPPPPLFLLSSPFSTSSRRKKKSEVGEEGDDDGVGVGGLFVLRRDPTRPPNLFVLQPRLRPDALLESKLSEALNLANSLEETRDGFYAEEFGSKKLPPHLIVQNPAARSAKAHADTYFGPGTVDNVKCHIKGLESELQSEIDAVFINANLSGIQQRNLEVAWAKPVLDRVGLIIEIFDAHAETKEAKLQSELAALMYKKTRLVRVRGPGGRLTFGPSGEAEVVSARGRGSGGRGFVGGAGETELQLQRRRIRERRNSLLAQIEEVRRTRALQRSSRRRHGYGQGLATVAVVGYTNAGKSTLVSALTETDLFSDDRLFATVDPRLRSVILPSGRKTILSDTVGFISDLPVQLVEAFHATLEEVVEADLLVHVMDSSAPNLEEHRSTVLQVLQQIGVSEDKIQNMIEVWNKSDLLEEKSQVTGPLNEDEFLAEGKEEEDGTFSEGEDDAASEMSSCEPLDNYEMASGQLSDESIENSDEITSELSPCELVNDDSVVDELSMEERLDNFDDQQSASSKDWEMTKQTAPSCHVKTSAVTGVGLQELLILIDEKLNDQKSVVQRSYGPFDRKWRPSCISDDEKAVE